MECGMLSAPPHVFRMVGGCASALYEPEQILLDGYELSFT